MEIKNYLKLKPFDWKQDIKKAILLVSLMSLVGYIYFDIDNQTTMCVDNYGNEYYGVKERAVISFKDIQSEKSKLCMTATPSLRYKNLTDCKYTDRLECYTNWSLYTFPAYR
jgi:hypothetical protein